MHSSLTRTALKFQGKRIADPSGTDWPDSTSINLVFDVNKKDKEVRRKIGAEVKNFQKKITG